MRLSIIYIYTNKTNGKSYVGQTINPGDRKASHIRDAMSGRLNTHFHCAIRKYGIDAFEYNVLETDIENDAVDDRERYWIQKYDSYKNGYNETLGGKGMYGVKHKPESLVKMKNRVVTTKTRQLISKAHKGKVISDEVRAKISKIVIQLDLDGNVIAEYFGANEAARRTNSDFSKICMVCRGCRKTHNGFKWQYKQTIEDEANN